VAQVSLLRPGFQLKKRSQPEHPDLKSETWATHSIFVRDTWEGHFPGWTEAKGELVAVLLLP
jgi:hypothetical protein